MKKLICVTLAFAAFAVSALALEVNELEVKVPFAFKAGGSLLPAGTYRVSKAGSGFLLIQGEKRGVFLSAGDVAVDIDSTAARTLLKFDRAGDTYVLHSVLSGK